MCIIVLYVCTPGKYLVHIEVRKGLTNEFQKISIQYKIQVCLNKNGWELSSERINGNSSQGWDN